jgi:3-deoxy-D-manno-octulosonic-acid transferase
MSFQMWYLLYNIILLVGSPVIVLILLLKKRCRRGLPQRLGFKLPQGADTGKEVLWIHAVSMGEVLASVPLVTALHKAFPHLTVLMSTVTDTGREAVEQRLAGIARHCYLPLDWPWTVRRFIQHVRPKAFLVIETELWPNVLKELHAQGVSSALVNGRLSTRSFHRYLWVKSFMKYVLSSFKVCLVQSDRDAERMISLGAFKERVHRTGNMKFDVELVGLTSRSTQVHPHTIGLREDEILLVAGSTHPKEEEILLASYQEIQKAHPKVVLLMAPRHIERSQQLEEMVRSFGLNVTRRSRIPQEGTPESETSARVIVLDSRGELAQVYALAQVAFVGGTFVPVGGHNLLEPASWGKPVLFGPFTDHCQEIAQFLIDSGGGRQIGDAREMAALILRILKDPSLGDQMGQAARRVVLDNQGVVKRNVELLRPLLES